MHKDPRPLIAAIGGASIDYKFTLFAPLSKETSNPVAKGISQGGVIRNVAENIARLGGKVQLYTLIGDDAEGDIIVDYNKDYMDMSEVNIIEGETTANYIALVKEDGNLVYGLAAMEIFEQLNEEFITSHLPCLEKAEYIVADMNLTLDAFYALINFAKTKSKRLIIIGVSGPKMARLPKNLDGIYLIITNRDEGEAYFNLSEGSDPLELAKAYQQAGATNAVVTNGANPTAYVSEEAEGLVPAKKVENIIDVTGAGDSFSGATIYALSRGWELGEAIIFGSANAAGTLKSPLSVRDDLSYEQLLKEYNQLK